MIVLIFTGGTISMRHDPTVGGAVPALTGRDILALAPGIDRIADLEVDDFGAFPGPHMTVERVWALRRRIAAHLARPEVQGVVLAHGTDSLEESAYLMARSLDSEKPIVFTGAMRTSSDLGWDGPANLGAAVLTAASAEARGLGVLVVMGDRIFSALDVTKVHTHMPDAFESPGLGPLGVVDDGRVIVRRMAQSTLPILAPEAPAHPVDIVYTYEGADARLLDAARVHALGVVVAAMGRGNVPPLMAEGIGRWIADGKPVVITSRALRGRVGHTYGYEGGGRRLFEAGALFAGSRRPAQARIDLMLALGAGVDVRTVFDG
ncbi:MAG: asparaginase [Gemmatimonadota bacterium]|nr:asparaginase [Gemmatimonadota bacterium]MDE3128528.1 asparaginase [Gemmatimonadota bacterium]MDE3216418.1 asparaginase [Gemmatimonadota bacterium]